MDQRPRLEDVAARVGVSTASVSLVLRGAPGPSAETRAAGARGGRRAGLPRRPHGQPAGPAPAGTCSACMLDVRNPFHAELVEEIHDEAERHRLRRGAEHADPHPRRGPGGRDAARLPLRGAAPARPGRAGRRAGRAGRAGAGGGDRPPGRRPRRSTWSAPADDVGRRRRPLDHLIDLGHRAIAFVDGGPGAIAADRRRGYRTAMRRAGLADRSGSSPATTPRRAASGPAAAAAGRRRPADRGRRLQRPLRRRAAGRLRPGRASTCPAEISVVGYDDSTLARLAHVDLTTVNQDAPRPGPSTRWPRPWSGWTRAARERPRGRAPAPPGRPGQHRNAAGRGRVPWRRRS